MRLPFVHGTQGKSFVAWWRYARRPTAEFLRCIRFQTVLVSWTLLVISAARPVAALEKWPAKDPPLPVAATRGRVALLLRIWSEGMSLPAIFQPSYNSIKNGQAGCRVLAPTRQIRAKIDFLRRHANNALYVGIYSYCTFTVARIKA